MSWSAGSSTFPLGSVRADVAYGGHFFVLASATEHGFAIVPEDAGRLAELGERIKSAAATQLEFRHPELAGDDQLPDSWGSGPTRRF